MAQSQNSERSTKAKNTQTFPSNKKQIYYRDGALPTGKVTTGAGTDDARDVSLSGGGVTGALLPPFSELPGARISALSTRSWWPAMPCCGMMTMPFSLGSFSAGVQAR